MAVDTEEKLDELAERVLATLKSWSDRFSNHVTHKRATVRRGCLAKTTLMIPHRPPKNETDEPSRIWVRNISPSGVGFISYGPIRYDDRPVVVKLGPKNMLCEIVRARQVHEGFWEYGSRFIKSIDDSELPSQPVGQDDE